MTTTPEPAPATVQDLAAFVNGTADDYTGACLLEAVALVATHTSGRTVPDEIARRAVLEVGADLYHRRKARNGVTGFDTGDGGEIVRINRDPMAAAYPLLKPYVAPGIA